jgi:hypothetical protein
MSQLPQDTKGLLKRGLRVIGSQIREERRYDIAEGREHRPLSHVEQVALAHVGGDFADEPM